MRPVLMASSFAPHLGGVERVVLELGQRLQAVGHHPVVMTNRWPKDLPAQETIGGLPVLRHVWRVPEPTARQFGGWVLHAARTHRAVGRQVAAHGGDIVNVHCVSSNGRYASGLVRRSGLPLVVSLHGELTGDASEVYGRSAQLRRTWFRLIDQAALVTAPSRHTLDQAEAFLGASLRDRGRVIPNGVDLDVFASSSGASAKEPFVLAVGRLVAVKGFDTLIRAWLRRPETMRGLRLLIAGDGPERAQLEQQAGTSDDIELVGALTPPEVAAHMARATAFVLPSKHEALGLTVLEAMASGTPVVAAHVGGVPELVEHGRNGLLFDGSEGDLLDKLAQAITDRPGSDARAEGARRTALEHSWEACAHTYEVAYRDALEAYRTGGRRRSAELDR